MTLGQALGATARGLPGAIDAVVAHSGTTHAGTPHWLLGAVTVLGALAVAGGWRNSATKTRPAGSVPASSRPASCSSSRGPSASSRSRSRPGTRPTGRAGSR
ncbi:hypothetical protein ACFQL4_10375 [Halosimplex aquaticum]